MKKRLIIILLISLFTPSSFSMAETVDEQLLDIKTREIAKTLRCTVCQSESVWESNAELARQMRQLIRERLSQGQSAEEIRAYFLSRYGDYILLEPRKSGMNWLLWIGPFVLLGIGGVLLYRTLGRWVAQTASVKPEETLPIDDLHRQRIEQELRSLEK
ncbi:MAG: cytochrome c-type biogenesis protein [Nitrospiria bacterium]